MNDHPNPDSDPATDPDLATRFAAASRPSSMTAVESDLDAVHRRSRDVQRRRILGGTAAAGLLVLGTGALVVTQSDDDSTVSVSAAAGVEEPSTGSATESPDTLAPADPAVQDDVTSTEPGLDGLPFDLPALDDFPVPELPPLPETAADGTTDWSSYVDQLGQSLETWVNELGVWLEANPEVTTWFELAGPFGPLEATIADGDIEDWLKNFDIDEWTAELDQLEFDLDTWLGEIDIDEWKTQFEAGEFDLDTWLDGLDVEQWDGELDVDRWLEDLGLDGTGQAVPLPDVENLDQIFQDFDLDSLDQMFQDLDLDNLDQIFQDLDLDGLDQIFQDFDVDSLDDLGGFQLPVDASGLQDLVDQFRSDG